MAIKFLDGDPGIYSGEYGFGTYNYYVPFEYPENDNKIIISRVVKPMTDDERATFISELENAFRAEMWKRDENYCVKTDIYIESIDRTLENGMVN
jgi:hypothetical protein